jgi:23S rRNA (cytidine1920-2'-O)/16S rRNA (cytidine1409-2'-O)-methyltransferase
MRLDIYLVQHNHFVSREQAKTNIINGNVSVNGKVTLKPSLLVAENDNVEVIAENFIKYVSRGGLKLEKALREFNVDCSNIVALDVGSSTGGFTDCLLQNGTSKVYSIDVGSLQLAESLKDDPRIVSIENQNITDLTPEQVDNNLFQLIVADLSFVSLTKVFEHFVRFLSSNGKIIALVKPQFEAGPKAINNNGLVRNPKYHIQAIKKVSLTAKDLGLNLTKLTKTPLLERNKNIEYLALFEREKMSYVDIANVVDEAFGKLAEL